jgi:hypothetical protein
MNVNVSVKHSVTVCRTGHLCHTLYRQVRDLPINEIDHIFGTRHKICTVCQRNAVIDAVFFVIIVFLYQ